MANYGIDTDALVARFTWADYLVFAIMLGVSLFIGVYYWFQSRNSNNAAEFLMASRSMGVFPISMSLIASFMSAITLLGTPAEVYKNGFVYWLIGFSYFFVMPSAAYLYLPCFFELQVTSAYEYLERRFSSHVRKLGSCVFILQMVIYMAIVLYAPSLALSQVTGMNVYLSVSLICFVCIVYTTLGGMKAVLWTDTFQVIIMFGSMIFVILKGAVDVGGFEYVWQVNKDSGRGMLVDWDASPLTRHTIWTLIIGGYFTWITIYGCNQAQVQRYLCVPRITQAQGALWINLVGLFILMIVCAFGGLVIYAKYQLCDPISSGAVTAPDQLFPLFVMDTLGLWQGLPGLFVAGIFSGALSTVSSGMNSLAAITLEDFIKGGCYPNISERAQTIASKVLSVFFGLLCYVLVFVAEQLGDVLSAALSIFGMVGGPLAGVFTLGMFFPWANAIGAFCGLFSSLAFTLWIGVGFQFAKHAGQIPAGLKLPTSIEGCALINETVSQIDALITTTTTTTTTTTALPDLLSTEMPEIEDALPIYRLSYMWYSATGVGVCLVVGMVVSVLTGLRDPKDIDPRTITPLLRKLKNVIPGLSHLGEDFVDETLNLEDEKHGAEMGNINPAFVEGKYTQPPPVYSEKGAYPDLEKGGMNGSHNESSKL